MCDRPVADSLLAALKSLKCHVCSPEETRKLEAIVMRGKLMNPDIVGLAASKVAAKAGFSVPEETTVLIAPYEGVGREHPLSHEKLCPLLVFYVVDGWEAGCKRCIEVLRYGGLGHTLALHCEDEAVIRAFALEKPVNRIVINSPSSQGAVGYSTNLFPSMTLGCGSFGGNITSDNIGPQHLLNIKRAARVRPEWRAGRMSGEFPQLPPGGESRAASSPWSEVHDLRPPAATEAAPVPRRLANPARIPFSREDVRSIIATRIRDKKER